MKILHYSLGFPPYRTGGLTKFCMDLMKQQVQEGHEVALLWPGQIQLFGRKTKIKHQTSVDGIESYEVINPLPVSYDEGIKNFDVFMKPGDKDVYHQLIDELQPFAIHVHTLMGLHKSLLEAAQERKIRLVFTTHDLFPICPKVTMFRHGDVCQCIESCEECGECNSTALSLEKIQILQSPAYRMMKDNALVKKLRKHHRDEYLSEKSIEEKCVGIPEDFKRLRAYYQSLLKMMDVIHYNSSVTKLAYEKVFNLPNNVVIPITHADIIDRRWIREYDPETLRIRYLGPQSAAKGYYLLRGVLDQLWKKRQDFQLDVHFAPTEPAPYMRVHEKYNYSELEHIFDSTDVLIAASICYETFGYTVLEALSYGVPVIVSNHVGAKDILGTGCGIVYDSTDNEEMADALKNLNMDCIKNMNSAIRKHQFIMTLEKMSKEINKIYWG